MKVDSEREENRGGISTDCPDKVVINLSVQKFAFFLRVQICMAILFIDVQLQVF